MQQYHDLIRHVLNNGIKKEDRTGTGTTSVFGYQMRFDLSKGFPLVTTKKVHTKSIIHELLWFLSGDTNIKYLKDNGVKIWDEWSVFNGDYPTDNRLIGEVLSKNIEGEAVYLGDYSTDGINAKKNSKEDLLRNTWVKMMRRCYDKKSHNYKNYGGRGVTVHKDWHSPSQFIEDVKKIPNWVNKLKNWKEFELDKDYYQSNTYSKDSCVWLHTSENNLYTKDFNPFELFLNDKKFLCMSFKHAEKLSGIPKTSLHRWAVSEKTNKCDLKYRNISIKFNFDISKRLRYLFTDGNLGPVYGSQWRSWKGADGVVIDQISNVVEQIKKNPDSRRLIVSAWNVADVDKMALPPCHAFFQFYVANGKLSCQLYQRSGDIFLGIPFNIASYALLTMMIAQVTGLQVGEFIHTIGDAHIYSNHIDQVNLQLIRDFKELPTMIINPAVTNIFDFKFSDFKLEGYNSHPSIKGEVAV